SDPNDLTQEHSVYRKQTSIDDTQPVKTVSAARKRPLSRLWFLGIPALIFAVLALATAAGYVNGMSAREITQAETLASAAQQQMDQGIEDLLAGNYELAMQRFEYVLSIDPYFPGAAEFLGQALTALNKPTPTASPIASLTPTATPDFSSHEGMFASAQDAFGRGDWTTTLDILIRLRGEDPDYLLEEVNRLMASSLRNRGMDHLFATRLEQGIFDLTLAERFGPLDSQAASWRQSAAFFIFANSYFGLDWSLASDYFGQICQANIWGGCTKYGLSAKEYASELAEEDYCLSSYYFGQAFGYVNPGGAEPTATQVAILCATATAPTPTLTTTPTLGTVTATATFDFTPTPSLTPSLTSSPTEGPSPTWTSTPTSTPTNTPSPDTPTPTETPIA
ncbi:MAG: hypothetical protein KAS80_00415, partial [Anaerolineales bacterium]|nr:hypothetical protein [Anaerolineales bacterium]